MSQKCLSQSHNVVDIIHGVIPYNGIETVIIDNPIFARLQRVLQSSLVYMTFPSNKVHRYEHSLGVMHLTGTFFYRAISNSTPENVGRLFDEIYKEYKVKFDKNKLPISYETKVYSDLKKDKGFDDFFLSPKRKEKYASVFDNALYRENTPSNLKGEQVFLYYATYEALRLAGLLHDVGHLPYSHVTEEALWDLYYIAKAKDKKSPKCQEFIKTMKKIINEDKKDKAHEVIGKLLSDQLFNDVVNSRIPDLADIHTAVFVTTAFNLASLILNSKKGIFADLHAILDGAIDCDRMDFTCRDLYCSGVSKEFPRYERIFSTVRIDYREAKSSPFYASNEEVKKERTRCCFSCNSKAIGQIELLLQRRWEDYTNINFHHSVHKKEVLLQKAIDYLGQNSWSDEEDLKKTDEDDSNKILAMDISALWDAIKAISDRQSVEIFFSQLDDEWMNTVIRQYYYREFGYSFWEQSEHTDDPIWNMFDELVTGRRHYRTLFKRRGGFIRFDNVFQEQATAINFDLSQINANSKIVEKKKYFFTKALLANKSERLSDYYTEVNDRIEEWIKESGESDNTFGVIACFVAANNISTGIEGNENESYYLVSSVNDTCSVNLREHSYIFNSLEAQKEIFPPFHAYYLLQSGKEELFKENQFEAQLAKIMLEALNKGG